MCQNHSKHQNAKKSETNDKIRRCVTEQMKTNKNMSEGDEENVFFCFVYLEELTFQMSHIRRREKYWVRTAEHGDK